MNLLLGVCGGIAAYKAAELVSLATKRGHSLRVILTDNAARFVGPVTFEALSGHPVMVGHAHLDPGQALAHIQWAKWADLAIVAPLSANVLGRLACGLADDALTTVLMALPRGKPVLLAPAMNTEMWQHPVVQRNCGWLRDLGDRYHWIEPVSKRLACGDTGVGGLPEPAVILTRAEGLLPCRSDAGG